jgi:hypothetical protein
VRVVALCDWRPPPPCRVAVLNHAPLLLIPKPADRVYMLAMPSSLTSPQVQCQVGQLLQLKQRLSEVQAHAPGATLGGGASSSDNNSRRDGPSTGDSSDGAARAKP